jgi:hypothetical protein
MMLTGKHVSLLFGRVLRSLGVRRIAIYALRYAGAAVMNSARPLARKNS